MSIHRIHTLAVCCLLQTFVFAAVSTGKEKSNPAEAGRPPKRLRRDESFFGIHFDLHARQSDDKIGKNVTPQMVTNIIEKVRPDYLQCDCKGHPGISSYPTEVDNRADGYIGDQLKIWRDITARHGVALYMHYSGVWDSTAVKEHPEWACVNSNGKRDDRMTSVFGPYVDELLIPQLKELTDKYNVDGVWVDGECWAVKHDWSDAAIKAFKKQTGIEKVPRKASDPHYLEYTQFCRDGFRKYFDHYVTELHKHDPGFQICGNWAFSSFMPEPVSIDVDFLSGDFSPNDAVNSARIEGRCLRSQGRAWDLMSWSFYRASDGARSTKTPLQLQQEAAVVLALGGGYQAYFKQKRDLSIYDWQVDIMAAVAEFCRARQRFCHKAEPVPQIALVYSGAATYRNSSRLFGSWAGVLSPLDGILRALLNNQYSVEVLAEHHLTGNMHKYPLIVIPEWDYLERDFISELITYTRNGGSLLVIGPKAALMFKEHLGVTFEGNPRDKIQWLDYKGSLGAFKALSQSIEPAPDTGSFGRLFSQNDVKGDYEVAASISKLGSGKIAAVYFDFGRRYKTAATSVARDFLGGLVKRLFRQPVVEVTGSHSVDVSVNTIDGKLAVNLVNTAGPHDDNSIHVFDDIPGLGPLEVKIRTENRPERVLLQPAGKKLPFEYHDGVAELTLPMLKIYDILIVE
jgi:hypothetical protein